MFHLPAVSDTKFALRNWLQAKRFVFWDEFSPVEFAQLGVMSATQFKKAFGGQWFEARAAGSCISLVVSTEFLASPVRSRGPSSFQVQVPQNAHDGNVDFRWQRGCVFTNKDASRYRHLAHPCLHRQLLSRSPRPDHDAQTAT